MTPSDSERPKLDPVNDLGLPPPAPAVPGAPATIGLTSAPTLPSSPVRQPEPDTLSYVGTALLFVLGAIAVWYVLRKSPDEDSDTASRLDALDSRLDQRNASVEAILSHTEEQGKRLGVALENMESFAKSLAAFESGLLNLESRLSKIERPVVEAEEKSAKPRKKPKNGA